MTIPDFQSMMLPILQQMADGGEHPRKELAESVANHFGLTDEERAEKVASGGSRANSRVWWALTHMSQAGVIERTGRGIFKITDQGRGILESPPDKLSMAFLMRYPSYVEFRSRKKPEPPSSGDGATVDQPDGVTPQDLLDQAVAENRAAVRTELLVRLRSLESASFERLVLALLKAMGYGRSGSLEHIGKAGDAGIDGIISQDPLGLNRIYLQAKRYGADHAVHRPLIQGFVGALMGAQGDRGVFITTSSFSSGAKEEADRVNARIELIDGDRLAELMVDYGVGVQPESTVKLHRLDEDFFEEL